MAYREKPSAFNACLYTNMRKTTGSLYVSIQEPGEPKDVRPLGVERWHHARKYRIDNTRDVVRKTPSLRFSLAIKDMPKNRPLLRYTYIEDL
jgi:hypothetical protein